MTGESRWNNLPPHPVFLGAMSRNIQIVAFLLVCLTTSVASAGDLRSFQAGSSKVSAKLAGPQEARFSDDEGYFETWMFMMYTKGGGWIQARFILTNVGPGSSHAAIDVMRQGAPLGGEAGKRVFSRYIDKIEKSVRKTTNQPLDLAWRGSRLTRTKKGYTLRLNTKGYEFEGEITARGPHWKPGNGEITFPGGGRFGVQLIPTLARVTGRERLNGGEWADVKGGAWGEHGFTNVMAHKLSKRFLRFQGRKGAYAVAFHEIFTPENFGEERMGFLVVTKGRKVVSSSLVAASSPSKFKTDRPWPHHKIPMQYDVDAPAEGGKLKLSVKVGPTLYREDVLASVPGWVRRVVELFIQPVNYYNRAKFEVTLPDGETISGRGVSLYSPMRAKL